MSTLVMTIIIVETVENIQRLAVAAGSLPMQPTWSAPPATIITRLGTMRPLNWVSRTMKLLKQKR